MHEHCGFGAASAKGLYTNPQRAGTSIAFKHLIENGTSAVRTGLKL